MFIFSVHQFSSGIKSIGCWDENKVVAIGTKSEWDAVAEHRWYCPFLEVGRDSANVICIVSDSLQDMGNCPIANSEHSRVITSAYTEFTGLTSAV